MLKLSGARLLGGYLSASRDRLREIAQRIGVRHLVNVGLRQKPTVSIDRIFISSQISTQNFNLEQTCPPSGNSTKW